MMDMHQVFLGVIAVTIMVCVPIVCVLLYDLAVGRWDDRIARIRQQRSLSAEHRRHVRALRHQSGVPIEQVASNLRRLRRVIAQDTGHSAAHHLGNRLAYDRVLTQACAMLDIEHDLGQETGGMERDIERLRVEAELERAGVVLSSPRFGQAA